MGKRKPIETMVFDNDASSYVIRMWRESAAGDSEQGEWRGWIQHVQSGKRIFFRDTAVITSFIDECLYSSPQGKSTQMASALAAPR